MTTQKGISLPRDVYEMVKARADAAGTSVSAWLSQAARTRALAEAAEAYAKFIADPDVAQQLAAFRQATAPAREARAAARREHEATAA